MIKIIKLLLLFSLFLSSTSCGVGQALSPQKKTGTDEFLIQKKSPLVMPPDYNELPQPTEKVKQTKRQRPDIKKIITGSENKKVQTGSNSSIEELILKEINKD
jgi:hypothetical protein